MKVGLDTFTIRELGLNPYGCIDWAADHGFEGVQFGGVRALSDGLDAGRLRDIRAYADSKGLYSHISVSCANPILFAGGARPLAQRLEAEVRAAAAAGWRELHSIIHLDTERYTHPEPWQAHINQSAALLDRLRPVLEECGARINLENHADTTFDLLQIVEGAGPDIVGICLDTANTFVNAEDPVAAARRVAPYTHLTHTKDAIVCLTDEGILRQGRPPGQGNVDFKAILPILGRYAPDLPLSIEDHKWLFTARIYDDAWMDRNPELTKRELSKVVYTAWKSAGQIATGALPAVEMYESTPYLDEMEQRLAAGRDYLKVLIRTLGLG